MLDLSTIDPETVLACPALDALIDVEWMGNSQFVEAENLVPEHAGDHWEYGPDGEGPFYIGPTYSTDPAHAGEARRKARKKGRRWELTGCMLGVQCDINTFSGVVCSTETNGDEGKAEALATCRAIVAAMKAAKVAGGES